MKGKPPGSAAADEGDDFDLGPVLDHRVVVAGPPDDDPVVLHGHRAAVDGQPREQLGDRQGAVELPRLAVQLDSHRSPIRPRGPSFSWTTKKRPPRSFS